MRTAVRPSIATRTLAVALLLGSPAAAQKIWTVDTTGAGDFLDTPAAVAAAMPGDVLLVKPGSYSGFYALGKGLTVLGEGRPELGPVRIEALPGDRDFVLSDLRIVGDKADPLGQGVGLTATACDGVIWVQDTEVRYDLDVYCDNFEFSAGVAVDGCTSVHFVRCQIFGPDWYNSYWNPVADGTGLYAHASSLHLARTWVFGAYGCHLSPGGNAVEVEAGELVLLSSYAKGGDAGDGMELNGGDGVHLLSGSKAWHRASNSVGGYFGCGLFYCGDMGHGWYVSPDSEVTQLLGGARFFEMTGPGITNDTVGLEFTGQPGDHVWLFWSKQPGARLREDWSGLLALGEPLIMMRVGMGTGFADSGTVIDFRRVYYGTINATGSKQLTVLTKDFPPGSGIEAETVYCQALHRSTSGEWLLSTPFAVTIKD